MRLLTAAILAIASIQSASATDQLIVPPNEANKGLRIFESKLPSSGDYSDTTFKAFRSFRDGELLSQDFYYELRIAPQYHSSFAKCNDQPAIVRFFEHLFGAEKASMILLKSAIEARSQGGAIKYASDDTPATLLMVVRGSGKNTGELTASNACSLSVTSAPTYPTFRFEGGSSEDAFDDVRLKFQIYGSTVVNENLLSNLNKLFTNISAAAAFVPLAGAAASGIAAATQQFDDALQKALSNAMATDVPDVYLKQGRMLRITIPDLVGNQGSIVIYQRRRASFALETGDPQIDASRVLGNQTLPMRKCSPSDIAKGGCNANTDLRHTLYNDDDLKKIDGALPPAILDPNNPDRQKQIYSLCLQLRDTLTQTLRLSTLDEMVVRWALLTNSQVMNALFDPSDKRADAIAKATGHSLAEVQHACWNWGDYVTVKGVAIDRLHKQIKLFVPPKE